ncbi:MAG: SpoIVB peptidase [Ruminococcaceae bacterium]|nr:SpoIVB peptidase [Oscillospiraceae bacterium]
MRKNKKGGTRGKRFLCLLFAALTLLSPMSAPQKISAHEVMAHQREVLVGGDVFGTRIDTRGVLVVGVTGVTSENKELFPARDAGICSKDIINTVNGKEVSGSEELVSLINESEGKATEIGFLRDGKEMSVTLSPVRSDSDGIYRAGLWVRDSLAGIGTVTFIIPETSEFAGLGHGMCDSDTGVIMPVKTGSVFGVRLGEIKRSDSGAPGELRGRLDGAQIGEITKNTPSGVYGRINLPTERRRAELCDKNEVKTGDVSVICTLDESGPREYAATIERICDADGETKNFIIKITDSELLSKTGGIVQGMSGSPILQNGKLVGAITHVLIDDPTKGYGIFAENMLENMAMPIEE